jgi:hypothetical protein
VWVTEGHGSSAQTVVERVVRSVQTEKERLAEPMVAHQRYAAPRVAPMWHRRARRAAGNTKFASSAQKKAANQMFAMATTSAGSMGLADAENGVVNGSGRDQPVDAQDTEEEQYVSRRTVRRGRGSHRSSAKLTMADESARPKGVLQMPSTAKSTAKIMVLAAAM